jgi:heme-degrading monooxygenase HmoA
MSKLKEKYKHRVSSMLVYLFLLQGCAYSAPFRGPGYSSTDFISKTPINKPVVVAVTNAKLNDTKTAKEFKSRSREIYKNLEENEGYIGGSVRLELFGDELWTVTVWQDKKSLQKFVDSSRHLDAVYMTNEAMSEFKHFNFEVPFKEIPKDWKLIDKMLSEKEFLKHHPY